MVRGKYSRIQNVEKASNHGLNIRSSVFAAVSDRYELTATWEEEKESKMRQNDAKDAKMRQMMLKWGKWGKETPKATRGAVKWTSKRRGDEESQENEKKREENKVALPGGGKNKETQSSPVISRKILDNYLRSKKYFRRSNQQEKKNRKRREEGRMNKGDRVRIEGTKRKKIRLLSYEKKLRQWSRKGGEVVRE